MTIKSDPPKSLESQFAKQMFCKSAEDHCNYLSPVIHSRMQIVNCVNLLVTWWSSCKLHEFTFFQAKDLIWPGNHLFSPGNRAGPPANMGRNCYRWESSFANQSLSVHVSLTLCHCDIVSLTVCVSFFIVSSGILGMAVIFLLLTIGIILGKNRWEIIVWIKTRETFFLDWHRQKYVCCTVCHWVD